MWRKNTGRENHQFGWLFVVPALLIYFLVTAPIACAVVAVALIVLFCLAWRYHW